MITFNDASDLDSAITAAQKIITRQALEPVNIIAETANPDIPPDVVENANNALIRNKISNAVFWDVNQTIRQAQELTRQFPGFALTVYNSHTDMHADLRKRVEAAGMTPSRVQAFIMPDSNDVILIANKVPPSQVAKVIGHEIIGHRGIRAVFGEDYDNLLDLVYRDHVAEIDQLAGAYARNPKNNLENQRYLTEEYLANCANAKVKPSWWKEFIARIRAWLRERFPEMRFTDKDIEGVLSMATRHLRKNSVVRDSRTAEGNTGDAGNNSLQFAITPLTKLDHSQYQENTMLSGDEDIALIDIPREYKTVDAAEKEITEKIKQANGRLIAVNEDQNMNILIQSNDSLDEAASEKAVKETLSDGTSAEIHAAALANIEQLLSKARLGVSHRDWHTYAKNQQRVTNKKTALQIHRFYTAMQYGDDIYGVKMTVREKQNGSTVFYTLEAHDLDIEKINPETESSRGGVVKAALPGRSPVIKFSSFFEKFKPIDDLLGFKYKEKYPEVRFSIAPDVDTPAFKNWFKDSKVVDDNGEPLVVYHGTDADFTVIDTQNGAWFSRSFEYAESMKEERNGERVIGCYLAIKNPMFVKLPPAQFAADTALEKKLIAEAKEKGHDGLIIENDTSNEFEADTFYVAFSPEQVKLAGEIDSDGEVIPGTGNIGTFDATNQDMRFLLSEYSEDQTADIVAVLRPYVGYYLAKDDADYQAHLKSLGIDVDVRDAHAFAVLAMRENLADRAARSAEKRKKSIEARNQARSEYLYNSIPLYREAIDFAGTEDFKIKPSEKFWPEEFSGSFISKEFIDYSKSKKKDKSKLYNASGINSNEFAESLARKWGRDALALEQEIIDFFRDLKKRDLYKEYTDFRKNAVLENKEANRLAAEEFAAQEKFRIENEVIGILERKTTITEDFVQANRAVYNELYRQVMKAEPPRQPRKHDVETLNAAVQNESFDSATFAAAYKAAREESTREYMAKLRELRDKVMANKADAIALQREAGNFVRKHLPREVQGNFIRKIVKLLDYSTTPKSKYPDGYRRFMFDALVKEVTAQANKLRKDTAIAEIHRLLDRNRTKRTSKNVPYSPMGARQGFLDRINHISRLKPENIVQLKLFALENADAIQERLDQLMDWKNEDANDPQNIERNELENDLLLNDREISILENFGALELKTADAVEKSLQLLKDFIFAGRNEFKAAMDDRSQRIREDREKIRLEMTDGNLNVDHRNDLDMSLDKYKEFILANLSDGQLMRNFSRIDDEVKFYKSAHGKLYRMIETATLQENNFLRDAQNRLNDFYKTHGLTAGKLGKFLKKLTTVQDTGIVVPVYGVAKPAQIQPQGAATPKEEMVYYGDESHGRPKKRAFVELEHTRKILEDIQDGIPISGVLQLGGLQNTIDLRNELKQAGLKTGRYFTVAVTANGYRIYTDTDNQEVKSFDLDKNNIDINRLLPAIAAIREANPDAVFPLDEFALESAKNKIIEYDGGMAARRTFDYGDDIDNAAMEAYFGSEDNSILKSRKIEISTVSPNATKRDKALKISPEVAVQIILTAEQENYKTNMKFNGFTDDKINELKAWVEKTLPGALEFGYTVRQIVKDQRRELNKAVAQRYGVALPDMPNFWYANFGGGVKDTVQDAGYGNPIGGLTVSANFLTARRYHTLPVDTQVGFMSLFMRKQLETAHFIAWSEPVRELRSIYSDLEVQNNLIKEFGHEAWQLWKKRIELLATGGDPGNVFSQFFNSMNQTFYPANIMLNVKSIVTQLAGGVSYSLYMPVGEMTKRLAIGRDTPEYHHFMAMVKASGYLENRELGGFDPSLKSFLMPFAKRKNISPAANKLMKAALAGTTWSDRKGSLYWGYMCYDYFRMLGLKRGMSAQDARKFAFDMWMRATDETQQSGEMKDLNSFNMNPGIMRAVTAYMTSPMQQFGLELSSIMRYMKNKSPEAKQEMIRRIVVNHFVNTTIMNLLASAFRHGINFGDYLDDWEDYVFGWLFGNLDAVAVVGKILKNIFTGQFFGTNIQLFPMADNIARDLQKISSDVRGKSEVEFLDYLQATGDLLMSAGPPMTRMVGAGLYISSRETKRIMRWFEDEKLGK